MSTHHTYGQRLAHAARIAMMTTLFATTALGVAGCGGTSGSPSEGTLTGKRWVLSAYYQHATKAGVPSTVTSYITFADGKAGGSGGVNQFGTTYESGANGRIEFGEIQSTMMAGPPDAMNVEEAVFAGLENANSYSADDKTLTLYDNSDNPLLVYDAVEEAGLVGTDWLVTNYNDGNEAVVSTVGDVQLTAKFDESGKVSGFGGVNTYSGDYTLDGSAIKIGPLSATKMAGPQDLMDQEALFLAALQSSATVIVAGADCELHTADNAIAVKMIKK